MSIKISELTPKGANLQNSDLLEISESTADGYSSKSITGAEIITAAQEGMQPTLVSGTNIKTINSTSLLGSGDVAVQPTLVSGTNIKTINGNSLLGSGDLIIGGGGLTIGTTAITSGTIGRILFEGTGNVLQESANLFWDNTNGRLGIGTSSPSSFLNVVSSSSTIPSLLISGTNPYSTSPVRDYITINGTGNVGISLVTNTGGFIAQRFYSGTTELGVFYCQESTKDFVFKNSQTGFMDFQTGGNLSRLRIFNGGNVAIGTTTDAGFKLDVNGTARISSFIDCRSYGSFRGDFYVYQGNGGGGFSITQTAGQSYLIGQSTHDMIMGRSGGYSFILKNQTRVFGMDDTTSTALTDASALLTMTSTTKGFLPPRMTTTQRNAIASPASGLIVYDTTDNKHYGYNGTAWTAFY